MAFADSVRIVRTSPISAALLVAWFAAATPITHAQTIVVSGYQTLNVNNGNHYDTISVIDTSTLNVSGGTINDVVSFDSSTVNMTGGTVGSLIAQHQSTVNIGGGSLTALTAVQSSVLNITGGSIPLVSYEESTSKGSVSGGAISTLVSGNADISITGGNLNRIQTRGTGTFTLTGFNFALTGVTAGTLPGPSGRFDGIYYTLTGRLQNNTSSGTYLLFDAATRTNTTPRVTTLTPGRIILNDLSTGTTTVLDAAAAPEPSTLPLLGMGLVSGLGTVAANVLRHTKTKIRQGAKARCIPT